MEREKRPCVMFKRTELIYYCSRRGERVCIWWCVSVNVCVFACLRVWNPCGCLRYGILEVVLSLFVFCFFSRNSLLFLFWQCYFTALGFFFSRLVVVGRTAFFLSKSDIQSWMVWCVVWWCYRFLVWSRAIRWFSDREEFFDSSSMWFLVLLMVIICCFSFLFLFFGYLKIIHFGVFTGSEKNIVCGWYLEKW